MSDVLFSIILVILIVVWGINIIIISYHRTDQEKIESEIKKLELELKKQKLLEELNKIKQQQN